MHWKERCLIVYQHTLIHTTKWSVHIPQTERRDDRNWSEIQSKWNDRAIWLKENWTITIRVPTPSTLSPSLLTVFTHQTFNTSFTTTWVSQISSVYILYGLISDLTLSAPRVSHSLSLYRTSVIEDTPVSCTKATTWTQLENCFIHTLSSNITTCQCRIRHFQHQQ